jgi:hypothetical protein
MRCNRREVSQRVSLLIPTLLLALALLGAPAAAEPAAAEACPQATFSRTFTHLGDQPVDGLFLSLHGPTAASGFYTGPENPFGEPELHGAGPDGTYRLRFGGASVAPGESVRVSFCIDTESADLVPLGHEAAQYWLAGGEPLRESEESPETRPQALAAIGLDFRAVALGDGNYEVQLDLTRAEFGEVEVQTLEFAHAGEVPAVDDFGWDKLEGQPWQALIQGPVVLPPRIADEDVGRFTVALPGVYRYDQPGSWLVRFTAVPADAPEGGVQGAGHAGIATLLHPVFLEGRAIETVAARAGVPAGELQVAASGRSDYPLQGATAHAFKLTDLSGEVHGVALSPDGAELEEEALASQEQLLHDQLYGRLDPQLHAHLETAPLGVPVPVQVWALVDPTAAAAGPARPEAEAELTEDAIDGLLAEVAAHHSGLAAAALDPVIAALDGFGAEVEVDGLAPIVHTALFPEQIHQLAALDAVDRIYLGGDTYEDFMAVAGPTVRANNLHWLGVTGQGTRVGFVEIHGGVPGANPFLQPNGSCPWWSGGVVQDPNACQHPHSTAVGGIIKSTHGVDTGIAPTTCLWAGGSCSNTSPQLQAASNRAAFMFGARAINLSWGSYAGTGPGPMDRFFDDLVINHWRTVVVAAGNGAAPCFPGNGMTGSPARAYNVITVGNFDDRNSFGLGDDAMGPCTSFVDPTSQHGDRDKPEVSAPGTNFNTTTVSPPWNGAVGSGTSYAAPVVTGGAADLFQVNSSLNVWPEATKAILMATAVHNIEGPTRMSERDGAGGVALDHARDVSANGAGRKWGGRSYSCAEPYNLDVQTMFLHRDQRTRVVLNWTTPGSGYAQYASRPSADLDLRILDPNGVAVAWSLSWDNGWEIVDFHPRMSGNYRIRVTKYSCLQSPRYIGWAWWQDQWMTIDGLGWEGEGAGLDVYDINGNGTPDLLLMVYDAPATANNFRYKIGWDMDNLGRASSWSNYPQTGGLGWLGQGAGVDLVNLDANPSPEMVLLAYDAPSGPNNFRYKIGWNVNTLGVPTQGWTNHAQLPGLGWEGQGAGLEILNLDSNPRPDMVIMTYDNPYGANNFRYKIGWNMNTSGNAWPWTSYSQIGGVGWEGQGAGVTLGNLYGGSRPEMLMMAYDNPWGANTFRYVIGQDVSTGGVASPWGGMKLVDGVGWEADGADPELFDIDNDGLFELFLMAYDDPWGANTFRYRVVEP